MAPTVPEGVPATLRAGDTWIWKESFSEYPATEGWTPTWHFRGASALTWESGWAVASGNTWTVTIPAGKTGRLVAGRYEWAAVLVGSATYAGREHTAATGVVLVHADLETAGEGDRQTWAEEALAAVEAVLAGRVTDDIASYAIGGRQVVKMPFAELMRVRNRLRAEVAAERRPGQIGVPVALRF